MTKPSSLVFTLILLSACASGCAEQKGRKKDEKADAKKADAKKVDKKATGKTKAKQSDSQPASK